MMRSDIKIGGNREKSLKNNKKRISYRIYITPINKQLKCKIKRKLIKVNNLKKDKSYKVIIINHKNNKKNKIQKKRRCIKIFLIFNYSYLKLKK